ncbi:uncharacterized [Tachysurus ichikawai]
MWVEHEDVESNVGGARQSALTLITTFALLLSCTFHITYDVHVLESRLVFEPVTSHPTGQAHPQERVPAHSFIDLFTFV